MLFFIFIAILVIGILLFAFTQMDTLASWVTAIGAIAVVISLFVLGCSYIGTDGFIAENQTRYEMLVYQWENDIYDNDNDLGKRELVKDIQEWNEDVARYQAIQDDFWVGIYHPNIYDQFEFIELE